MYVTIIYRTTGQRTQETETFSFSLINLVSFQIKLIKSTLHHSFNHPTV